jgi:hypothetical protein
LSTEGHLPDFDGATGGLNSQPLTTEDLRGKVVLVDFWTYTCINWLRTLTYVRAWVDRRRDLGLVVASTGNLPATPMGSTSTNLAHGTVTRQRLYQLIRQPGSIADRTCEITFLAPASRPTCSRSGRPLTDFVGRRIRAAGRAAADDAGWVVLVEDLQ